MTVSHQPDAVEVRPGEHLDWATVEAYLRDRLPELVGRLDVLQFPKGSANLTYLIRFGDRRLVLRRPPFGRLAPGAHDMGREFKTLSRLWRSFPPAPRGLLFCDDEAVIGAKFFVMEFREGVGVWDEIPVSMRHHPDVARRIGFAVVDTLAELHHVDPASCELSDLGRPDGFVQRQVAGWRKRWSLVTPEQGLTVIEDVGEELAAHIPRAQAVSILHNDIKIDNCQFNPNDPDHVKSVFDWDMATLGDPLIDVGTLLNYWPDPSDNGGDRGVYVDGMENMGLPTQAEILERYARQTGFDLGEARWYHAFATWKTAIVLQQLYDRYLRGETTDLRMATRGARVAEVGERALGLLRRDP